MTLGLLHGLNVTIVHTESENEIQIDLESDLKYLFKINNLY